MISESEAADRFVFLCEPDVELPSGFRESPRILRDGNVLRSGDRTIRLPSRRLLLGDAIIEDRLDAWRSVVDWLADQIGSRILMLPYDEPLRELGQLGLAMRTFKFGLLFRHAPERVYARDYSIFTNASLFLFADPGSEEALQRAYVPYYHGALAEEGPHAALQAIATSEAATTPPGTTRARGDNGDGPRILLVAYYSGPARTVGANRINYWHSQIPRLWPGAQVALATPVPWDTATGGVMHVADLGAASLVDIAGQAPQWAGAYLETEKRNARSFNTLGHTWRIALENHFGVSDERYDVVIITGNPFGVFDFAAYAKRRWSARVVLDYRDPFANNPRMAYSTEARDWARYIERGYNFQADLVTVVNKDCAAMVEGRDDVRVAVVPNGFDKRRSPTAPSRWTDDDGRIHFVHAGTIFHDRSPNALIGSLDATKHRLHHIGNVARIDQEQLASEVVRAHGMLPYDQTLELVARATAAYSSSPLQASKLQQNCTIIWPAGSISWLSPRGRCGGGP